MRYNDPMDIPDEDRREADTFRRYAAIGCDEGGGIARELEAVLASVRARGYAEGAAAMRQKILAAMAAAAVPGGEGSGEARKQAGVGGAHRPPRATLAG
jgi:hypothetical protein